MIGETATTCSRRRRDRVTHAGHSKDRTDRHDRVRWRDHDRHGRCHRVEDAGRGLRSIDAVQADGLDSHAVLAADEVLLEPDLSLARDDDSCLHPVVAHRNDAQTEPPRRRNLGGHLRQRCPLVETVRAIQVRREVAVTQAEPRRAGGRGEWPHIAVALQSVHRLPALAGQTPARLGVDRSREGVGDGVEVGADVEAVQHDVVTGVHDRGDVGGRGHVNEARQEPGGAHATGKHGDHRGASSMARR